ncbi:hypothetical protein [Cellulosispirillum alkaliphilum]|uniref:hypothetical protein n=1 Tax=Cellulosispirillum alkaliphilum TaxID=3039283 RepID=UPI003D6E2805
MNSPRPVGTTFFPDAKSKGAKQLSIKIWQRKKSNNYIKKWKIQPAVRAETTLNNGTGCESPADPPL